MKEILRKLAPPLLSLVILIMASALFSTFISLRLQIEGFSKFSIGMIAASTYAGILIGSLYADRWIQKLGHLQSFALFIGIVSILIALQSVWIQGVYWALLRFIGGLCMSGIFIVVESWLLLLSPPQMRGRILSLYLALFYGGLSFGQLLIHTCDLFSSSAFWISGILSSIALIPLCFCKAAQPILDNSVKLNLFQIIRLSPLGFLGGIISGILLAAIYGLVPIYGSGIGLKPGEIGNLMAMIVFGGLSMQWPLGRLADKSNRRNILNITATFAALFGAAIGLFGKESMLLLLGLGWLFGGFAFTIYPLSMAYTCEKVQEDEIVAATGGFVLSYGIGAVFGPVIGPIAMHQMGGDGLFYFLGAVSLLIPFFSAFGQRKKLPAPSAFELQEISKESPCPNDQSPQEKTHKIGHLDTEGDKRDHNEG